MPGAADWVHLQEIVGSNPRSDQASKKRLERIGLVVDAAKQHGLIHHRQARVRESRARDSSLLRELLWVVEMGHHPGAFVAFANCPAELVRDALREGDRRPSGQPHVVDVLDVSDSPQQSGDSLGGHQARVAAREDDVMDLGVSLEPGERGLERRHGASSTTISNEPGSRAEAAVHAAAIGGDQQNTVWIALNQMRGDFVGLLAERVAQVPLGRDRLFGSGNALAANGARWVGRVTQREIVRGDRNGQPGSLRAAGSDSLGIGQDQSFVESL